MKNIILSATLLVALSISAFANDKNANPGLLKDLSATFKKSSQVSWIDKSEYRQAMFSFRNKTASAFYSTADNELIGFGIAMNKADIPSDVTEAISNKYSNSEISEAMIFITPDGYLNYFVKVHANKKDLVLKVTPAGHVGVYAKMPCK